MIQDLELQIAILIAVVLIFLIGYFLGKSKGYDSGWNEYGDIIKDELLKSKEAEA